ncbi:MAG: hypothetical protein PHG89_09575 [Gallionella sp.]|nr:hypothetical protein [Gallionella sp.]
MKTLISLLLLLPLATACASGPGKSELDAEVNRLCAIDGGIKVYETVKLSADKFNKYGQINFYKPTQGENTLGPEYIYKWDIHYYKKGEPAVNGAQETSMRRDHIKITRKSDMKLLGEVVMYNRGGGDLPGPWVPSSYHCPDRLEATEGILMNQIFIKSIEGDKK